MIFCMRTVAVNIAAAESLMGRESMQFIAKTTAA